MTDPKPARFAAVLKRKHEIAKARCKLRDEECELDLELRVMAGVKVGDMVDLGGDDRGHVNTVEADIWITDFFEARDNKHIADRVYLQVHGTCSPITKAGTPHKTEKYRGWSKVIKSVWITLAEYRQLCPNDEEKTS